MSRITSIDSALDFMPEDEAVRPDLLKRIRQFFKAISDGVQALEDYERMTAHGVSSPEAVEKIRATHFKH